MADQSQRPNKVQLIRIVTEVYENLKENPDYIDSMVEELNKRAVPRLRGDEPWTVKSLKGFFRNFSRQEFPIKCEFC